MENQGEKQKVNEQLEDTGVAVAGEQGAMSLDDILIQYSSDETVIKINMLLNLGVSKDKIEETYKSITSDNKISGNTVIDTDNALKNLSEVFTIVATDFSNALNGIVIDLTTGKIDKEASLKQAIQIGLDVDSIPMDKRNKDDLIKHFKEISKNIDEIKTKEESKITIEYIRANSKDPNLLNNLLNQSVNDLTVDKIRNSKILTDEQKNQYEKDFIKLQRINKPRTKMRYLKVQMSEDPFNKEKYLQEMQELVNDYPELESIIHEEIKIEQRGEVMREYAEMRRIASELGSFSIMDSLNELPEDEFTKLHPTARAKMCLLGLTRAVTEAGSQEIKVLNGILKKLNFSIDLEKMLQTGEIPQEVSKLFGEKQLSQMDLYALLGNIYENEFCSAMLEDFLGKEKTELKNFDINAIQKISDATFDKYFDRENQELKISKIEEKNFFYNSKLELEDIERDNITRLYYETASKSWISTKKEAREYRYLIQLTRLEEKFKDSENKEYKREVKRFKKTFKDAFPEVEQEKFDEEGKIKAEYKEKLEEFINLKATGDLLENYLGEDQNIRSAEDYEKLPKDKKSKYLQDTLTGLFISDNDVVKKYSLRRLEMISNKEKPFLNIEEIDEDKNFPMKDSRTFCFEKKLIAEGKTKVIKVTLNEINLEEIYNELKGGSMLSNVQGIKEMKEDIEKRYRRNVRDKLSQYNEIKDQDMFELDVELPNEDSTDIFKRTAHKARAEQIQKIKEQRRLEPKESSKNNLDNLPAVVNKKSSVFGKIKASVKAFIEGFSSTEDKESNDNPKKNGILSIMSNRRKKSDLQEQNPVVDVKVDSIRNNKEDKEEGDTQRDAFYRIDNHDGKFEATALNATVEKQENENPAGKIVEDDKKEIAAGEER